MIKVASKIEKGMRFVLPEKTQKMIFETEEEEIEFLVEDIQRKGKRSYVICRSCEMLDEHFVRFAMTKYVANYIFGDEVYDLNEGFSFKEYIPKVGSEIMVTNQRDITDIIPGTLNFGFGLIEVNGESLKYLRFEFEYFLGKCHTDLNYFLKRNSEYTWKFINSEDDSCMTDYEKVFQDTLIHKKYLMISAQKLAAYLRKEGAIIHAELLLERALIHDNSKITCLEELDSLSRIINDKTNLKNPSKRLTAIKEKSIKLHWQHNSHHPEHYKSVLDMALLDILEMCCDWHARSMQFGTELIEFVDIQNEKRFHFPEWKFNEILHYCKVLSENDNM